MGGNIKGSFGTKDIMRNSKISVMESVEVGRSGVEEDRGLERNKNMGSQRGKQSCGEGKK